MKGLLYSIFMFFSFSLLFCGGDNTQKSTTLFKKIPNGGEVNGPRSVENIEKNINILLPRLYHFYTKKLKDTPDFEGTIELIFDVADDGTVAYVSVGKSSLNDPDFQEEVLTALSNHTFDEWREGSGKTEVIYPLTFTKPALSTPADSVTGENVPADNE